MSQDNKKQFNATVSFSDKQDWDSFKKLCKKLDTSAAREIRIFIRDFKTQHKEEMEKLF